MSEVEPEITELGHAGRAQRYCLERGCERWYVDVRRDGELALATGFRAGRELEGEPPAWVREQASGLVGMANDR